MTILLDTKFARTLSALVARVTARAVRPARLDAWVFEDAAARRQAEAELAALGVTARIRSAYKPLLHAFLEDIDRTGLRGVTIALPAHPSATAQRFQGETYPLVPLLAPVPVVFAQGASPDHYVVRLDRGAAEAEEHLVFAPNRLRADHLGEQVLAPSGWLRLHTAGDLAAIHDAAEPTEYEQVFEATIAALRNHAWPASPPYFDVLDIAISTGGIERKLPWHDECLSTREALHEDLYFSALELFQRIGGRPPGDRDFRPGQIVPDLRATDGPTRVRIALRQAASWRPRSQEPEPLELASRPLTEAGIEAELARIGGERFAATSVQGRLIRATYVKGTLPGLVISSGQHANETSGPIGALRAARRLLRRPETHFALIPQENPDGYALHHHLRAEHPRHMHHAARFTALGDDVEYRTRDPLHEKSARLEALRRTGAELHINLHGYPAHEWTRPLTGYLPRGSEEYAIPKGFFLILRHHPGLAEAAHGFLQELSARLIADTALRALNEDQIAAHQAHAGPIGHPIYNGIVCMIGERAAQIPRFTLITEFPDETIYGDAFRLGHATQMNTVLHAAELYLDHHALT